MTGELRDHGKNRSSLWGGLLFVALALGYSCATGPFRAADEPAHFFRAYGISEGQFVAQRERSDLLGSYLPANIPKLAHVLGAYPQQPVIALAPGQLASARHLELKRSHRDFVPFPGAAMHSPAVYLPAALGITLGRLLHLGPLFLFYCARCSNALVVAASLGWGISRIWRPAPFLAGVALFPMTLAQVGTVTADAVTFAVTFCWLAEVLSLRVEAEDSPRPWWRWALFALLLSQLRFPYPLLGLLIFCVPSRARGRALFLFLLFAPCLLWLAIIRNLQVQTRPFVHVDPAGQLAFVLGHPLNFLHLLFLGMRDLGITYWHETVGVLGWLDFPVPGWILVGLTLGLLVTTCSTDVEVLRLRPRFRTACLALGIGGLVLTALLAYMAWNKIGAESIEGWQGRYSLPLLPLLLLALANGVGRRVPWLPPAALAFAVGANLVVILLLARATYGSA